MRWQGVWRLSACIISSNKAVTNLVTFCGILVIFSKPYHPNKHIHNNNKFGKVENDSKVFVQNFCDLSNRQVPCGTKQLDAKRNTLCNALR